MDWYTYRDRQGRAVIRPMTAGQATKLGAELVPDFDPAERVSGLVAQLLADRTEREEVLLVSFPPEGEHEQGYDLLAEISRRG